MAKISTYPSADNPLLLSDRLIGTEAIRPVPSPTPLATKNFSLADLLQLFSANFPAPSLQAVLNTGNTATQNITLTGTITTTLIKPINIEDTSGSQGLTFQVLSKGTSSINWVSIPVDTLQAVLNAGNTATQNITLIGDITSTKIIPGNIQDELGFIGTLGQFLSKTATGIRWVNTPAYATPTLGDVVSVGDTANQDIFINTLRLGKGTGTGSNNTALGFLTLGANTTGFGNVGVGAFTLVGNTIAARNTAVGYASLYTNISGNNNTSVGMFSQYLSTTGIGNVSLGYGTLQTNVIGNFNTALGYRTLLTNKADKNTAIGAETMFLNSTGTFNTVVGQEALRASVAGSYNSIVGNFSILNAEASYVSALGRDAGRFSSAGNLLTSSESIFIGFNSKSLNTSSTNEIVIGANAIGEGNNTVTLGHTTITSTRLWGAVKGGSFVKDGGTNLQFLMADGSVSTGPSVAGYVPYVGATTNLNMGAFFVDASEYKFLDSAYSVYGSLFLNSEEFIFKVNPTTTLARLTYGQLLLQGISLYSAKLTYTTLTADRTYALPNASGTIALTSDLTPYLLSTIAASTYYPIPTGTISQYIRGDGTFATFPTIPTVGTWGALNYPAWTTGTPFVKMTAVGTFALDTNTYLTGITSSDVTTALGYTPVTNARTLTINGVTYDLTADRSWTIATSSSPLTTKGDLYTFSTVDARLPVGTDGQILSADSAEATGLKWINVPATDVTNVSAVMTNPSQTVVVTNPTTTPQITIDDTNFMYNKFMVNQYGYLLPSDTNVIWDNLRVGGTLLVTGTNTALSENPMGQLFQTATAVSSVTAFFGTNFGNTAFLGVNFAFDFSYRFRINTTNAAQRFFAGLSNMYGTVTPTNIEPTAMINSVGVAKLQGSANLFFIYNDATGTASSLDLGSGFLGTDTACTYRIRIWKSSGVAAINIQLTKVVNSSGVTTTTSVLTITSDYNTGVNHHAAIWMGNNTAATGAVSFKNYGCELSKRNIINA